MTPLRPLSAIHIPAFVREGLFVLVAIFSVYFLASLLNYYPGHLAPGFGAALLVGKIGRWLAQGGFFVFGYASYLLPPCILLIGWHGLHARRRPGAGSSAGRRLIGLALFLLGVGVIAQLGALSTEHGLFKHAGGTLGQLLEGWLLNAFGLLGSVLAAVGLTLTGASLVGNFSWSRGMRRLLRGMKSTAAGLLAALRTAGRGLLWLVRRILLLGWTMLRALWRLPRRRRPAAAKMQLRQEEPDLGAASTPHSPPTAPPPRPVRRSARKKPATAAPPVAQKSRATSRQPSPDLLDEHIAKPNADHKEESERIAREVEKKLLDFRVDAHVTGYQTGPVITCFELQPAAGVKASTISGLAKDLARSLAVQSVRVVELIPGKSVVGLEIPNRTRATVTLRQLLKARQYRESRSPLTLVLGANSIGTPSCVDLASLPHLLVAGTTGAGKSVAMNVMLLSLLYKSSPEEVRLLLVDPKMLELSVYQDIPHLLTPVITDAREATKGLRWCVTEMDRRYRLMSRCKVRHLSSYNAMVREAQEAGAPLENPLAAGSEGQQPELLEPLPYIVVFIDEFADMIMLAGKEVEHLIVRIAQKARAAGIHLILATQRPSVNVITGLIKANIPGRVAFQVAARVDSRTILDQGGAEHLLGAGDMLYLPPGTSIPQRIHGAFVSDGEVKRVVAHCKAQGAPRYIALEDDSENESESERAEEAAAAPSEAQEGRQDSMYDEAVRMVRQSRRASASAVQRRFRIGYNRAARLLEAMEQAGVVSASDGAGKRKVLLPAETE